MKSRNRKIGCYYDRKALRFDRHLGSSAAEMPVKFKSDWKSLNLNLTASRLYDIIRLVKPRFSNILPSWALTLPEIDMGKPAKLRFLYNRFFKLAFKMIYVNDGHSKTIFLNHNIQMSAAYVQLAPRNRHAVSAFCDLVLVWYQLIYPPASFHWQWGQSYHSGNYVICCGIMVYSVVTNHLPT